VLDYIDPTTIAIAVLIWPATKSVVVMGAAAVSMWSRDERRRRAAERIIAALGNSDGGPSGESQE
jgi:hypothetical protein